MAKHFRSNADKPSEIALRGMDRHRCDKFRLARFMVFISGILLCVAPQAQASDPVRKLGRGLANIAFGWAEFPVQIARFTEISGSVSGLTVGSVKGLVRALARSAVGVLETATFLIPNGSKAGRIDGDPYGPLFEPEFIILRQADKS